MDNPMTIVVAGGGTAGWMTAAALGHFLDAAHFRVVLVESDAIGSVGVGEATIPQIQLFNQSLGIDEDAFLRATGGTFKLGIEFDGWRRPGERYMHAFGDVGRPVGLAPFHHAFIRALAEGVAGDLAPYSLNNQAALAGRMQRGPARTAPMLSPMPYAFHYDAGLYARFLRTFAEARGVVRIEGRIVEVERGAAGDVAALALDGDRRIAGDLFVDCTGFRGLLIAGALGVGFEDWTHWLPCDRAIALPSALAETPPPYTRAIAHAAGWQWRIPLQHRTGNGIVYASDHLSDDAAEALLRADLDGEAIGGPNRLRFVTGRRTEAWRGNVIAIGLASGFLEPLESTSIHMIQSAIERLLKLLPGRRVAQPQRDEYNRLAAFEAERVRDFLILHYVANERDEPFWRERRAIDLPDSLAAKLNLWRASGHISREREELFTEVGWFQVLVGQGVAADAHHPAADVPSRSELAEYLDLIAKLNAREVAQMPSHKAFVARHCAMPPAVAA